MFLGVQEALCVKYMSATPTTHWATLVTTTRALAMSPMGEILNTRVVVTSVPIWALGVVGKYVIQSASWTCRNIPCNRKLPG